MLLRATDGQAKPENSAVKGLETIDDFVLSYRVGFLEEELGLLSSSSI